MTPRKLGHRAAAWGEPKTPPSSLDDAAKMDFALAYGAVEAHRARGLDPNGHGPMIPHLCERSMSATVAAKVCNCCSACSTVCWAEKFEGTQDRLVASARGLLRKILPRSFR